MGAGLLTAAGFVLWATEPEPAAAGVASLSCLPRFGRNLEPGIGCLARF